MRKMFLVLAVLVFATPALAGVDITCAAVGNEVTVSFDSTEPNLVRAFALDITLDNDVNIVSVSDFSAGYDIYPGSIVIVGGAVDSNGSAVCTPDYPGTLAGPPDSNGMTIEMGSLYAPTGPGSANAPAQSGILFKFIVDGDCTVSIDENVIRGGVVMEDPDEVVTLTLTGCLVGSLPDCFPSGYTTYPDWVTMGKPDCWCAPPEGSGYQCDGDTDGLKQTPPFYYRVYTNDLGVLFSNWKKKITDPTLNPCADIDHKKQTPPFYYRVYTNDLGILFSNWKAKDSGLPGDCPRAE